MPRFVINQEYIPVSSYFIDNFLKDANGAFLKVYLYALKLAVNSTEIDTTAIASELNLLESDVLQAFAYWKNTGMIVEDSGIIEFCEKPQTEELGMLSPQNSNQNELNPTGKKSYDSIEVAKNISENSSLSEMALLAQELLAKPLTTDELETLYWFYDELGFSAEAILLILDYCISRDKTHIRYIEKVAVSWHEKGIISAEDIVELISQEESKNTPVYRLRQAMGIAQRPLSSAEEKFLSKWCYEFSMPEDLIVLAYEYCLLNTSKLSFPYMDKIIERWKSQNICSRAEAEEDNQKFKAKNQDTKKSIYNDTFNHSDLEKLTRNK